MPYIKSEARELLDPHIARLVEAMAQPDRGPIDAGYVNYVLTRVLLATIHE
jgi:hypothetical protein